MMGVTVRAGERARAARYLRLSVLSDAATHDLRAELSMQTIIHFSSVQKFCHAFGCQGSSKAFKFLVGMHSLACTGGFNQNRKGN